MMQSFLTAERWAQDLPVVVDDDFDEGPLPEADGSGCEDDRAPSQAAAVAPAEEQPAAAGAGRPADTCVLCGEAAKARWIACGCGARTHVECLGEHYLQARCVSCPLCRCQEWRIVLEQLGRGPSMSRCGTPPRRALSCLHGPARKLILSKAAPSFLEKPVLGDHDHREDWKGCHVPQAPAHRCYACKGILQGHEARPALPEEGTCPACGQASTWTDALRRSGSQGWARPKGGRKKTRAALKADFKAKWAARVLLHDHQWAL